jgi:hypothetical protein
MYAPKNIRKERLNPDHEAHLFYLHLIPCLISPKTILFVPDLLIISDIIISDIQNFERKPQSKPASLQCFLFQPR